jgi:hypothetical protein
MAVWVSGKHILRDSVSQDLILCFGAGYFRVQQRILQRYSNLLVKIRKKEREERETNLIPGCIRNQLLSTLAPKKSCYWSCSRGIKLPLKSPSVGLGGTKQILGDFL